jgi:predicted TIM-barrel fold metal-dependent hydrolase
LWSAEKLLSLLVSYLDRGKVDWAIGFYELPPDTSNSAVNNRVIPLLSPRRQGGWSQFVSGQFSEAVLRQYLHPQGLFWGVGEIVLYESGLQSVTFDSPVMQTVFKVVNELKGIVMIHPSNVDRGGRPTSLAEIEPSVRKYPDAIFLFHGSSEVFNLAVQLMSKYPNVYFTMDAVNWIFGRGAVEGGNPLSDDNVGSFLTKVNRVGLKDRLVEDGLKRVAPLLQQYPDRIMWGTDIGSTWHFEEPVVTDVVISLSRQLIGRLPADIQEKYAYKNAQRVFGRFLTPKP